MDLGFDVVALVEHGGSGRDCEVRSQLRRAALGTLAILALVASTGVAAAHSLESSTISIRIGEGSLTATVTVALETLDRALGTSHVDAPDVELFAAEVIEYLDAHLAVTGSDGRVWPETYAGPIRETVEGIESLSVDIAFDAGGTVPVDLRRHHRSAR